MSPRKTRSQQTSARSSTISQASKANKVTRSKNKENRKKVIQKASLVPLAEEIKEEEEEYVFHGYDDEAAYLKQLVEALLKQNKANSVIVCGDAGFGKSHLVQTCLNAFPIIRGQSDPEYDHLAVELFQLDGNLHGKNDLATLRYIGRRLNPLLDKTRQVMLEEESSDTENDDSDRSSKVANSIPKIIAQLHHLIENNSHFRCIIVLDNFEVFSYRQQYLLYNLFDLIQQGQSVLIIGMTRRLDCIQLLTSRVQSRLNRRMIHLVSPFRSLEDYTEFCKHYWKQIIPKGSQLTKDFTSIKEEISKLYSISHSFSELMSMIQLNTFVPKKVINSTTNQIGNQPAKSGTTTGSAISLHKDSKIVDLMNLTKIEYILLFVATRNLRNLDEEMFSCKQLHEWARLVPQTKNLRFDQVVKCIYKMIELDLLIVAKEARSQSSRTVQLWITPWTTLMLNISEFQLRDLIEIQGSKVPAFIKQMLN